MHMPEAAPLPDSSTEVARAVRALLPGLRRIGSLTAVLIAVLAVAAGLLGVWGISLLMAGTDAQIPILGAAVCGGLIYWAHVGMIRRQEGMVMPVLASTVGLTYSKDAKAFIAGLPQRLLPKRGIRSGEDYVYGILGAHTIRMAEVKVETGGKNSRTLFQGLVAQFPNQVAMPAFFIALEDKTRPGMFFGGDLSTEGLFHLRDVITDGRRYGIWTSWSSVDEPPALAAVIDVLTHIETHVGPGAQLYAATSNGEETHIALTHGRNLFRVGGMFIDENDLFRDVRGALQDLTVPLTLAQTLISAEAAAVQKGA